MSRDARSKSGTKGQKIGESVNDTLETLELAPYLDRQIIDIVRSKGEINPKLYEKIVQYRLAHGKQPDPHDEFAHMSIDEFRDNVLISFAKTIHPKYRDRALVGIKEALQELNLFHNCPLYEEGQLKKKSQIGSSPNVN